MQKLLFILAGIIFLNTAEAQKNCKPSGYAFSILIQPGTKPVDENGVAVKRAIKKERFIYIMTPGNNKPMISSILYGKTAVKWDLPGTTEKDFSAVGESDQKTIKIKPAKGCSMWRINIQENAYHPLSEKVSSITIRGKVDNKPFSIMLNKETAVQGFETY